MMIELGRSGSADELHGLLKTVAGEPGVESILIMACDANGFTPQAVDPILAELSVPVFGGTFPEIIYGVEKLSTGTVVFGLRDAAQVEVIPGLSDDAADFEALIDRVVPEHRTVETMFVFVDGLGKRIGALIDSLFNVFGLECNYIGGGAGSLSFVQRPCLFTNAGLLQDCTVLALTDVHSGVGVSHGWTELSGPYQVTRSAGPVIQSLDGMPAGEVYRGVVEPHSGKTITTEGFFEIAKGFPFGISKLGAEKIVRDPISMGDDDSLVCVGDVPQGSFVHILHGNVEDLVAAARRALDLSRIPFEDGGTEDVTLLIDCISRVLVLGDDFSKELEAVHRPSIPLIGALTLGEIANSGKDYLEFYNKTSVVGVLGHDR